MISRFKVPFSFLLVALAIAIAFPTAMAFGQDAGGSAEPAPAEPAPAEPAPAEPAPAEPAPAEPAPAEPTIKSDKEDYPPGALVTLTGSGWRPGEVVNIYVNDDQGKTWERTVDVTADANGAIRDQFNLPERFVATYQVRATGPQSGVATWSFTDASIFVYRGPPGNPPNVTFDVDSQVYRDDKCTTVPGGGSTLVASRVASDAGTDLGAIQQNGAWVKLTAPQSPVAPSGYTFDHWENVTIPGQPAGTPIAAGNTSREICVTNPTGGVGYGYRAVYRPTVTQATVSNPTASTSTFGGRTNLAATVAPAGATGSVAFYINGSQTAAGTAQVDPSTGRATLEGYAHGLNASATPYSVRAVFSPAANSNYLGGQATNASALTVAKAAQTITFGALDAKAIGAPDFRVSATATSNLPVTFRSETPSTCTVNGDTVHIVAAGTCTITASQAGNDNYQAAADVSQSFAIGKTGQTINFAAPTGKTFGDADFAPGATASSGLAVGYSSSTTGVCTIDSQTNNIHIVSAGTCTVTASQAGNNNYNPAESVTRSFTIAKANQAINFATGTPTAKAVDDPDFQLSATSTSNLTVTFAASPSSTCTVTGNTVSIVGAGTCTITATQAGNDNYQAANATHTINVSKADQRALSVTSPTSGTYGDRLQMSASGGSGTGAVSFAATGAACEIPTSGTDAGKLVITSGTGNCSITATKAGDNNYQSATSAPQQVAISKAELRINADNQTVVYGAANPDLTYKLSGFVNGDTSAAGLAGDAACSIANGSDSNVGTYTGAITCAPGTLSSTNYRFATGTKGDVTITKREITYTADAKTKTYGEDDPALTGSITTGNLVGNDALSGNLARVTGENVGSYDINQGTLTAGGNYELTYNGAKLTIGKAALTVKAENKSKTYGDANPTFTGTLTGVKNNDAITANYSSAATPSSNVGTYAIVADVNAAAGVLDNYTVEKVNGELTVGKAALTVRADDKSKTYGEANPEFTGTLTGVKNNDAITANYSSAATPSSNVGSYAIVADVNGTQAVLDNYSITRTNGELTVGKAALTVKADNKSKTYGDANPEFTGTLTGVKNNDAITASYDTTATQQSGVGTYTIAADVNGTQAVLDNYSITRTNGELTVDKAALTVKADNATKVYGAANPDFTVSYDGFKNGDTKANLGGQLQFSTNANAGSSVGTYDVTPSGLTSGNYNITFAKGTLTVDKADLTVTADDKSKTYGDVNPDFTVSYSGFKNGDAANSLGGTLGFDTNATISSPVGTYDVTPSGLTSGNYNITFVKGTLTIDKRAIEVTADNKTKTYGENDPALTYKVTGGNLANGDAFTGELTRQAGQDVGTYDINQGTLSANSNYTLTFKSGTLTINKAALTVTADNKSKTYGDANPTLTASYSGFVNGDTQSVLSGSPALNTSATQSSNTGTYAITAAQGTLAANNYSFTFKDGTLTINKAALTVTADNKSKTYGDVNPDFTVSYSGFKNGDAANTLGGTLGFDTNATQQSAVGTYAITPKGLTSDNYNITYKDGTLTVNKADLTVKADNATKTYGDTNPQFSGTLTGVKNNDAITASYGTTATQQSAVGTYDIVPTLNDLNNTLGNYNVTKTNGTLTVNKADLTVTTDNKSKTYGDANPNFTVSYDGFKNGDAANSLGGTLGFDTNATTSSPVGTYDVTPKGLTSGNYNITFVKGALTVTKADLTVTTDNKSKTYGDATPTFTGTLTGVKNGDNITANRGSSATASSNVGTYDITATLSDPDSKLGNYNVTNTKGTLTINKADLTVTADNKSKIVGAANPTLTGTLTGVKNNDAITASYSTTATQSSPVGTYPITPSLADPNNKLGNYNVTKTNGTLTINYDWRGFLQPINDTAHMTGAAQSKFKLGQTIPVRFAIYNAAGTAVQQTGNPTFTRSNNLGSCDATTSLENTSTLSPDAATTFTFNGGQYHYNWSTKNLTAGEYRIYANLADGTKRYVDICLTR